MRQKPLPKVDVAVIDTTVLLKDPYAPFSINADRVIVPFHVIEELDKLKYGTGSTGRHARQAIRVFERLRLKGDLHTGVALDDDGEKPVLQITTLDFFSNPDMNVAQAVMGVSEHFSGRGDKTMVISQDINLRFKAASSGIESHEYRGSPFMLPHEIAAVHEQTLPSKNLKALTQSRVLEILDTPPAAINQFIKVSSENNPEAYRLFRYLGGDQMHEVNHKPLFGCFMPKNIEQEMALDLLLDDSVKLVSLIGIAGTGKTFLVLLAGLAKMLHARAYRRVMVTRPTVSLGPDIGFLPGDVNEKLESWMQPVYDNIGMIARGIKGHKMPFTLSAEELAKNDQLCLQAITYMRGRSLPEQYLFVDEAQNLTPLEMKTLITRAGGGTKVIIAGDPEQIDCPQLNYDTNGLMVTTRKFKNDPLFGVVHLHRSERSALAQRAAELL